MPRSLAPAKLATLIELRESFDLDDIDTLAVGDGANDLGMIEHAGLGVAYHAKPAVAAAAAARIDFGDLTALLYAQGYRRARVVGLTSRPSSTPRPGGRPQRGILTKVRSTVTATSR